MAGAALLAGGPDLARAAEAETHKWLQLSRHCSTLESAQVRDEVLRTALAVTGLDAAVVVVDDEAPTPQVSSIGLEPGEEAALVGELPPFPLAEPVTLEPGARTPPVGWQGGVALPFKTAQMEHLGRVAIAWRVERARPEREVVDALAELLVRAADLMVGARQFETVRRASIRDHLTGLYSSAFFQAALEQEVAEARRHGRRLSIAILDLDDFHAISDAFGSTEATGVLAEVAARLGASTRKSDVTSRIGGDAFGVILPGSGSEHAETLYERARTVVAGPTLTGISMSLSAGIAELADDDDAASLLAGADAALRRSKFAGKNRSSVRAKS